MRKLIRIAILKTSHAGLYLAGNLPDYKEGSERIYIVDAYGERTELTPVRAAAMDTAATEDKKAHTGYMYEITLPLRAGAEYSFVCESGGKKKTLEPRYGKYSRLTDLDGCYFECPSQHGILGSTLIVRAKGSTIEISSPNPITRLRMAKSFEKSLAADAPAEVMKMRKDATALKKTGKPVWLISDRSDSASDNGEVLFKYLMNDTDGTGARDRYDIRFVISKDSPDYDRMKAIGPVVESGSYDHKLLYLASDLMISSAGDEWVRNPLGADRRYCRDLIESRFVFLQHGVIMNDLSDWLFKLKKDLDLFITSASAEYDSICGGAYGYDNSTVKLTGLARYDEMDNTPHKTIAILPSWRKYAAPSLVPGSSVRPYSEDFKETEYFRFYNKLINDPSLIAAMKESGYTGTFYLHPSHMNQWRDFDGNDTISIWKDLIPFRRVFNENALFVTDYSSTAIDFAYLGKPVLYAQFDREDFFGAHTLSHGYFDYERDGFGPVCTDYESTVKGIIEILKNDCSEPDIYSERVKKFFAYRDRHNCRRIYEELIKL